MSRCWLKSIYLSSAFLIACAVGVGAQTIPSVPVLKSPANGVGGQSILKGLSWNTAASATSYEVQIATSSNFGATAFDQTGTAVSALLKNLFPSTTYFWHAQASNTSGPSGWSATWSFTTVHYIYDTTTGDNMTISLQISVRPTFNGAPLGVYDEVGAFSKAGLCVGSAVWDSVKSKEIIVVGQDQFSSTPDGLNEGDSMFFRAWHYSTQQEAPVAVVFSVGSPIYSSGGLEQLSSLTACTAPGQPTLSSPLSGSAIQPISVSLSWNSAALAASYTVQVATNTAFSTTVANTAGLTDTTFTLSGLSYATNYYWQVKAINTIGVSGAWSSVWSFTTTTTAVLSPPANQQSSLIKRFDLTGAYPNPFRGCIRISFDVPGLEGINSQGIELDIFDMKGSLVHQLARGAYAPGHYTIAWAPAENKDGSLGSSMYIIRMKAKNFDKLIKLIRAH